jgi:hypothetical protein
MKDEEEEKFSEDPEEQLKIENDILKLKLQAELGGDFIAEEALSPDVENAFLKNILEFEHRFANATAKTIFEILDNPAVVKEASLDDQEIENALTSLEELMEKKGIVVDYGHEYDNRLKYKFITEELFYKEATFLNIPGMTMHYIYEEFHPNHSSDIKQNAERFFTHWIERSFDENSFELASNMILETGAVLSRIELLEKFRLIFDAYVRFDDASFSIADISFELAEDETGLGFAEGTVSYEAVLENGEVQPYSGPFKLYMQYDGFWSIFFFHWPGFAW